MPPLKFVPTKKSTVTSGTENPVVVKTMNTRSTKSSTISALKKENAKDTGPFPKRKAVSPIKGNTLKRSALGNITNAIKTQCTISSAKKNPEKNVSTVTRPTISTTAKMSLPVAVSAKPLSTNISKSHSPVAFQSNASKPMLPPLPKSRLVLPVNPTTATSNMTGASLKPVPSTSAAGKPTEKSIVVPRPVTRQTCAKKKPAPAVVPVSKCKVTVKPKCMVNSVRNTRRSSGRRSTLENSDSSLYVSALSDGFDEEEVSTVSVKESETLPVPDINIDEEYANDPFQCAAYAKEIFDYLKSREEHFKIKDYMEMQTGLNSHIRAIVVDWMVEIQENFELNHETLYLGVKMFDSYLSKIKVSKQSLQLIGATAMFIAAKYDERIPPAIEDFLYICDGAFRRRDVLRMEVNILKIINMELGYPLSYRFLRRYARCAKSAMPMLTLARFILEFTLMDYSTTLLSDSKMAAAALYLAFKMKKEQNWDNTLIHFSGYKVQDFIDVAYKLNDSLHQKPRQSLATVRTKYSHKLFYEVANIPLVSNDDL